MTLRTLSHAVPKVHEAPALALPVHKVAGLDVPVHVARAVHARQGARGAAQRVHELCVRVRACRAKGTVCCQRFGV